MTYRAGKKASSTSQAKAPSDVIGTSLTEEEEQYLDALAVSLYNDMSGVNWNWNGNIYDEVSLLSDSKLVALSNIFNFKFEKDSGETLLQWLENENFNWNSFSLDTKVQTIKNRLRNLGVS
jgi:hypothetical protein